MPKEIIFDKLLTQIDRGREGLNVGLENGFDRLNTYLFGIQKSTYYTIGGETGSGKSSLALNSFVYCPYVGLQDKSKLRILYLSFELPKEELLGKLVSRHLYERYGIIADINELLSRGKHRLTAEVYKAVIETRNFFEEFEDHFFVVDSALGVDQIDETLGKFTSTFGTYKQEKVSNKDGFEVEQVRYTPYNPDLHMIVILDHAGKIPGGGGAKKNVIDAVSEQFVQYRNCTGMIPVMINQLNRDNSDVQRQKMGQVDPKLTDWKDTGCVTEDCNVALAVFNPKRHNIDTHHGYDIGILRDRYRSVSILKNRYGGDGKYLGMAYYGEIGKFIELPNMMTQNDYERFGSPNSYLEASRRIRAGKA